jgi:16S rRNA processing protein RimM
MMEDLLLVGRVARAHGNRGQVIVNLDTDFPDERFVAGKRLLVEQHGRADERRITSVRFHQGRPVIALEGVESMDDAEALAGAELKIPAAEVGPLAEGTFYHHDLIGSEVLDTTGRRIGTVDHIDGPMARSLLAVRANGGGEVLIPLVAGICVKVDPAGKTIVINPPDGLIELNER